LADKFAAFEARFPANPLEGFGDSFADFDLSDQLEQPEESAASKDFTADFDSAFTRPPLSSSSSSSSSLSLSIKRNINVKKSKSVNIFKRVDDPFDDDFFQVEDSSTNQPQVQVLSAVVEDPFAWVQPFDDNVHVQFDEEEFEC